MSFDLGAALRRRKPEKRLAQLRLRPSAVLATVADAPPGIVPLLIDTNVYIRVAQGTLPSEVRRLLDRALLFHCAVCLAEITVGVANADPTRTTWPALRDHYIDVIDAVPESRVLVPDSRTWSDAGLASGILARTQRYQSHQRKELLNDALIFFTAAKEGLPVLTSNRSDFDLLQQIAPEGRFFLY